MRLPAAVVAVAALIVVLFARPAQAIQAVNIGELEEAAKELDDGDPQKADLYFRIAEEYGKQRQGHLLMVGGAKDDKTRKKYEQQAAQSLARAVAAWERLLDDPLYATYARLDEGLALLATLHGETGRTADAIVRWERLIKDYPSSRWFPDAWVAIGDERFAAADMTKARRAYAKALKFPKSPVYVYALYKTGWVDLNEGKAKAAFAMFTRTILAATAPGQATIRNAAVKDAVRAYADFGVPAKARAAFERLNRGGSVPMLAQLAELYEDAGTSAKATIIWRALLAADPSNADACSWRASLITSLGRANAATKDIDAATAAATAAGCPSP